jgi:thymidylate synthase (FAD)
MRVIKPSVEIESVDGNAIIRNIEKYGRTCYKSESRMTTESAVPFIKNAIKRGHYSIIEHEKITARVICDRGVTHEIVRHRIGSYSQESTRYVNYKEGIEVIEPNAFGYGLIRSKWESVMQFAEDRYKELIELGVTPEIARGVLPHALKTEIVITFNLREWRHFFWMRGSKGAHPQIREVAIMLLDGMKGMIPAVFDDFEIDRTKMLITTKVPIPS